MPCSTRHESAWLEVDAKNPYLNLGAQRDKYFPACFIHGSSASLALDSQVHAVLHHRRIRSGPKSRIRKRMEKKMYAAHHSTPHDDFGEHDGAPPVWIRDKQRA